MFATTATGKARGGRSVLPQEATSRRVTQHPARAADRRRALPTGIVPHSHSSVTQLTAPEFMRAVAAQKDVRNLCVIKARKPYALKSPQLIDFKRFDLVLLI